MKVSSKPATELAERAADPLAVCTLPTEQLGDRLGWIRREILPHSIETLRLDRGLAFELNAVPGLAAKLDRLIQLEQDCCSGIVFERLASATPDRLRLEVRGVDPDAPVFRPLLGSHSPPPSQGARFAKAAGVGMLASVFVCCVLPIAAGVLIGGAAAPLTTLDGPGPIAVGAILGGVAMWWWQGRRTGRGVSASDISGSVCGPGC